MSKHKFLLSTLFLSAALIAGGAQSAAAQCYNGNVQPSQGEECDPAQDDIPGDCCDANCQFEANGAACGEPASQCANAGSCNSNGDCAQTFQPAGTPCGDSTNSICDAADTCDGAGSCNDNLASAAVLCRASLGVCDAAENCDGAGACPADNKQPSSTVCRASAGICDVGPENCTGSTNACPNDVPQNAGAVCRASGGFCDPQEVCDGTSGGCPIDVRSNAVCRPAAGVCDEAESCDGGVNCPGDAKKQLETFCRASLGVCDYVEVCDGSTNDCGPDAKAPSDVECRASAGICDVGPENCTGSTNACPADVPQNEGSVCRSSTGVCDPQEVCDGTSGACPDDDFLSSATTCRVAAGDCDVAENCTGSDGECPTDAKRPNDFVCRPLVHPNCDVDETCDGGDNCPDDQLLNCGDDDGIDCTGGVCLPTGECTVDEICIEVCRGPGFWQTHSGNETNPHGKGGPNVAGEVFGDVGFVDVCGIEVSTTDIWNTASLLEGICVRTQGVKLRQLNRQLLTAAMNCQISEGGDCDDITGRFVDVSYDACNALCTDLRLGNEPAGDAPTLQECKDQMACFNGGGRIIEGECVKGTCAGSEDNCGDDEDCGEEGDCVRFEDSCAGVDLCTEDNDSPATICPEWGRASSPKTCRDARKTSLAIDNY